jgi:hypothetical protein
VEASELSTRELLTDRSNSVEGGSDTTKGAWKMSMERGQIGGGGSAARSSLAGLTSISRAQQERSSQAGLTSISCVRKERTLRALWASVQAPLNTFEIDAIGQLHSP